MEDNNLINKESVEALIALTDIIRKSDPEEKIVKYNTETIENLYDVVKNTEGISTEEVERIKDISKEARKRNQQEAINLALTSDETTYFGFAPKVCTELYEIFKNIEKSQVLKIPQQYIDTIIKNRDIDNPVKYDWSKPLVVDDFEIETIRFLNWVCYQFWLETDEEKENWKNRFNQTDLIEVKENFWTQLKKFFKSK